MARTQLVTLRARPRCPRWMERIARRERVVEVAVVLGLGAIASLAAWQLFQGGTLIGMDTATAFYPWYTFLGSGLRNGAIPTWNPHQFAGMPFAADPESGWMYLPAMLLFSLLDPGPAFNAYLLVHVLLAATGVYGLARAVGMPVPGAVVASTAYTYSGFFLGHSLCCFAYSDVATWLPVVLLGVQWALDAATWRGRLLAWALAGFALSQILAVWLGQGAYYSLLVIGAFVAFAALVRSRGRLGQRVGAMWLHGCAVVLIGLGLGAAGVLPRLEFNAVSNLPGGYGPPDWPAPTLGTLAQWGAIEDWDSRLLAPGFHYVGGATLALALVAPLLAGRRFGVPFFAALAVVSVTLARWSPTPLHWLLALLPAFAATHAHAPERLLMVFFLGPAMLAGATVSCLWWFGRPADLTSSESAWRAASGASTARTFWAPPPPSLRPSSIRTRRHRSGAFFVLGLAVMLAGGWLYVGGHVPLSTLIAISAGGALVAFAAGMPRSLAVVLALGLVVVDLRTAWQTQLGESLTTGGAYQLKQVDLDAYYAPTGAARFLRSATAATFDRYIGYAQHVFGGPMPYTLRWSDPDIVALEVNNRALVSGLYDAQGYNPLHLARYDAYVEAMNGGPQNYHQADVFPAGLNSPLLDLLGVRYIVIPAIAAADQVPARFDRVLRAVYQDGSVVVLENEGALPRVWLVHAAQQTSASQALVLLSQRAADPRQVALIEAPPPALGAPPVGADERVSIASYAADRVRIDVRAAAPGLIVLSDAYDPAWRARLDGAQVEVYVADGALRAVAVPAGQHVLELQYASPAMERGLAITLATVVLIAGALLVAWRRS